MLYVGYVLEKLLDVNISIDNVVTSDLVRMGKISPTVSHAPAVPRDTAGLCDMCSILIMDVIILCPRQARVYMLLNEGLLILGICGQT